MILQAKPPGFEEHTHQFSFLLEAETETVWSWLCDTKTFTETQYWPWRVEFYSPDPQSIPNGFHEGVFTNHSGPFINFAGVLTKIEPYRYRDLQYLYGSYAFSFQWVRPFRLEFWVSDQDGQTEVTCAISSYVRPSVKPIWAGMQRLFWGRFRKWASKATNKVRAMTMA